MSSIFDIFRRSLKTGLVTTGYPDTEEPAPSGFRGQVQIDTSRCIGHGDCARACPSRAITVSRDGGGWTWELNDARCVFCGLCAEACPESALSLSNECELAVRDAADLITRVSFTTGNGGKAS